MPKVSVIIPVYNASKYLRESLSGVLNQTLTDIEIIIVDDGSTDESPQILQEFAQNDERMHIYKQKNSGGGAARELGLSKAQGEYVLFLDADDIFEPDLALFAYNKAKEHNADITIFRAWSIDDKTGVRKEINRLLMDEYLPDNDTFSKDDIPKYIFQVAFTTIWNKMFRRDFIIKKDIHFQNIRVVDTMSFVAVALAEAECITCLKEHLITYRENNDTSQRGNVHEYPLACCDAVRVVYNNLVDREIYDKVKLSFINFAADYCFGYMQQIKTGIAYETLYNTLSSDIFPALGADTLKKEDYIKSELYEQVQSVVHITPAVHLFNRMQDAISVSFPLPENIMPKRSRVILYGAGNAGKQYFIQNLMTGTYDIVAWVDKAYDNIGFPVTSPDNLVSINYDYILVSVQDLTVARTVAAHLVKKGIPKAKIMLPGGAFDD